MFCLILIVGGLLTMMGQHDRSEALFYYFRLEDQVPETHLLRLIEKHISCAFARGGLRVELMKGQQYCEGASLANDTADFDAAVMPFRDTAGKRKAKAGATPLCSVE